MAIVPRCRYVGANPQSVKRKNFLAPASVHMIILSMSNFDL